MSDASKLQAYQDNFNKYGPHDARTKNAEDQWQAEQEQRRRDQRQDEVHRAQLQELERQREEARRKSQDQQNARTRRQNAKPPSGKKGKSKLGGLLLFAVLGAFAISVSRNGADRSPAPTPSPDRIGGATVTATFQNLSAEAMEFTNTVKEIANNGVHPRDPKSLASDTLERGLYTDWDLSIRSNDRTALDSAALARKGEIGEGFIKLAQAAMKKNPKATPRKILEVVSKNIVDAAYPRFRASKYEDPRLASGWIGVEVKDVRTGLGWGVEVVQVIHDDRSLQVGDKILKADEELLLGDLIYKVSLLRGEPGTTANLEIEREGFPETVHVTVRREQGPEPELLSWTIIDGVGYIRIQTSVDVGPPLRKVLAELRASGNPIVIDLRDSQLSDMEPIAEQILGTARLGSTISRAGVEMPIEIISNDEVLLPPFSVVLINEATKGMAELLASALRIHRGALVIGCSAYGGYFPHFDTIKGNGFSIKYPTSVVINAEGRNLSGGGIEPDVEISSGCSGLSEEQREKTLQEGFRRARHSSFWVPFCRKVRDWFVDGWLGCWSPSAADT